MTAAGLELPVVFTVADRASIAAYRAFTRANTVRIVALLAAAVGGAASWTVGSFDAFGILGFVSFGVALAAQIYLTVADPETKWASASSVAEVAKSLAWRYMAGDAAFPLSMNPQQADAVLVDRLKTVVLDIDLPASDPATSWVPESMRALRNGSYERRRAAYLSSRIADQEAWYQARAWRDGRRLRAFKLTAAVLEAAALGGAALKALNLVNVDLLGILGAGAAGLVAWGQVRNYEYSRSAYPAAFQELRMLRDVADHATEDAWPRFVQDAEAVMARERMLWFATKGLLSGARRHD